MRSYGARCLLLTLMLGLCCLAAKKKNKEDFTQTLSLPKDPPAVAVGDSRRLTFQVSPLSAKGLLSQQVRDALKAILKENGNSAVVHIRAFVAGSGDIRRIPQIVSDVFTEKKASLPSVSVVLAGALPLPGAQVVLEAVSLARKDVHSGGLAFVTAEPQSDKDPEAASEPLLANELAALSSKLAGAQPVSVTCYSSGVTGAASIGTKFPGAAVNLVQPQRLPAQGFALCEAVARSAGNPANLAFTGSRVAFGSEEKDAALAWQRLDRDLTEAGAPSGSSAITHLYQLRVAVAEAARKLRPGNTQVMIIQVEGLASIDAGFAVDAVAVINK